MTISNPNARLVYNGDGATLNFNVTYKIFDEDDLKVTLWDEDNRTGTLQVKSTHYDVVFDNAVMPSTSVVQMDVAPANGPPGRELLIIERIRSPLQDIDLRNQGSYLPQSVEDAIDKVVQLVQQIEEMLGTTDRASARIPMLGIGDASGSGAFDFLSNRAENLDDAVNAQDAVTLAQLALGFGSITTYTTATRPTAEASTHLNVINVNDGGADQIQVCLKNSGPTYSWQNLAGGLPW